MQIIKDPMKSTSDKQNSFNVLNEMSILNIPFSSTPKDFFKKFGVEINLDENFSYGDFEILPKIWSDLKHEVAKNDIFDEAAKKSIMDSKIEEIGVQKVTYLIDENEDYQTIAYNLRHEETNAIFRAVVESEEEREITVYSSRFGIWKDPNNVFKAKQNTGSETNGQIRYTFTARGQKDINSLVNIDKGFNYAVYEDLENLFTKDLISNVNGNISKLHLKVDLSEDELKEALLSSAAVQIVKNEVSHTNKEMKPTNASTNDMKETIDKNESEIRSIDEREVSIERVDTIPEYETGRVEVISSFLDKQIKDLEEKQALEKAVLMEKINSIMINRAKLKQDAIVLLQNGMSLTDMNTELLSKKYNDLQVQIINEEFKKEIIDSVSKENELKKVSKELAAYVDKNEKLEKSKKYFKEQFENMQKNLSEEQANHKLTKAELFNSNNILDKATTEFENQKQYLTATILDLKEEKKELKEELEGIEAEIEEKVEVIQKQTEVIKEKEENILLLAHTVAQKDEKIIEKERIIEEKVEVVQEQKQTIAQKDEKIEKLFETNSDLKADIAQANETIKNLTEKIEQERKQNQALIGSLRTKNTQIFEENTALKGQLSELIELKKELEQYKKNAQFNQTCKEKISDVKDELKKDEKIVEEVKDSFVFKSKLDDINKTEFIFPDDRKSNNNNNEA